MLREDYLNQIRGLSPGALRLYKSSLPQRLKTLDESTRNNVINQLKNIPEFADLYSSGISTPQPVQQPQVPERRSFGQKALSTFNAPFEWVERNISKPFATAVTAPFTPELEGGQLPGETAWDYERRQYEQWKEPEFTMPWGGKFRPTKGIIEALPWFAIPQIGMVGKAGQAGKLAGQLGKAATKGTGIAGALGKTGKAGEVVGTALEYSPWGLTEKAAIKALGLGGKAVKGLIPKAKEGVAKRVDIPPPTEPPIGKQFGFEMPDLPNKISERPDVERFVAPTTELIEESKIRPDWQRRFAQWGGGKPILKNVIAAVGGPAATVTRNVEDTVARSRIVWEEVVKVLGTKGNTELAGLGAIAQDDLRLFTTHFKTGLTKDIQPKVGWEGASRHILDIAQHPNRYVLNKAQSAYIKKHHEISDWVKEGLKEAGIDVKELEFDEFSHWVHRVVTSRNIEGALKELRRGSGRLGAKASYQKQRFYEEAAEALKEGVVYEPSLYVTQNLYIQAAARQIAGKRVAAMIEPLSRSTSLFTLPKTIKLVNEALRKMPVKEASLKSLERDMPITAEKLRRALALKDWDVRYAALKEIRADLADFIPTSEEKLYMSVEKLTTQKVAAENAVKALQRAIRGETIPTSTVKAIEKVLPDVKGKLREVTKVVLDDLVAAGKEAAKYPIELPTGPVFRTLPILKERLANLEKLLKASPKNAELYKTVVSLRKQVAFAKYRLLSQGKSIEFTKSPVSILTVKRKVALQELIEQIRGKPFETKTATGKQIVKFEGGILKDLWEQEAKAKQLRTKVQEKVAQPIMGVEATIQHPAFQGKIYPIQVAEDVEKFFADRGFKPLMTAAIASGVLRTLVATADFSGMFIQGLPILFRFPKIWAEGAGMSFKTFAKPQVYKEYLVKEKSSLQEFGHYGGYIGGFEYTESMPQIQKGLEIISNKLGMQGAGTRKTVGQTYGRFEASFGSFGDVARNNLWKALKKGAKTESDLFEIARHINLLTGVMSSKGLGLGKNQRDFEQAFLMFAPRYTRAGFALISDIFKGGWTGDQTRKAMAAMLAGGFAFYNGICAAMGQKPNLDWGTGKFMTVEIQDPLTGDIRNVGVGGMMTSLIRFSADVTASMLSEGQNEPLDFKKLNRFDNPFIHFMYGKSAPLVGLVDGLVSGKDYFGAPFENVDDYANFISSKILPISIQGTLEDIHSKQKPSIVGVVTEQLGLRVFPQSVGERRADERDKIAQEKYGMSWDEVATNPDLGELYQEKLERANPILQDLNLEVDESQIKTARGEGLVWNAWRKEGTEIEEFHTKANQRAADKFKEDADGVAFRESVEDNANTRRAAYAMREQRPEYVEIYQFFNEPISEKALAQTNQKDLARREYYKMMYAPEMYDEFGTYRFDLADKIEDFIIQKYGQETLTYIEDFMGVKREDEPNAVRALQQVKNILKPYWDIETQVWSSLPTQLQEISKEIEIAGRTDKVKERRMLARYPQIVWARLMIARERKRLKQSSPEMAQALQVFYSY
uniref:Uncharacterized protein n=1 Tax=viral metagenome TaxID=1070528 RepID=A0A6M3IQB1_9ZZZZ